MRENITLIYVTMRTAIERWEGGVFIVDTGSSSTIVAPLLITRLGLSVPANAPRKPIHLLGGQKIEVPFIRVDAIRVGQATLESVEVGVYEVAPEAPAIEGVLGGDFLHHFRVTIDKAAGRMQLEPLTR
ncbi:MAG: retropepsin-like domain-containing protein [Candidatus Rokubacteria bacterium]|nr:retropepsin-like domain-containing protein [Candidatus Rokubacteria bacterium]MBI2553983.1 retropepsin-like domain-containing protein [Candidatus Rokubacteria bacterium]